MTLSALARTPMASAAGSLTCLLVGGLAGCGPDGPTVIRGSGAVVRDTRVYRPADSIEVEGHTDLVIEALPLGPGALPESSGAETTVYLEGAEDLLDWVETTLDGDTLTVRIRDNVRLDPLPSIEVQSSYLVKVTSQGGGDILIRNLTPHSTRRNPLELDFTGSADLQVEGAVNEVTIQKIGSGDLDLRGLKVEHATYSGLGSGDVRVFVSDSLNAALKGSGTVFVHGPVEDERITSSVFGSGSVERVPPSRGQQKARTDG